VPGRKVLEEVDTVPDEPTDQVVLGGPAVHVEDLDDRGIDRV
jgi:hypothetical protein